MEDIPGWTPIDQLYTLYCLVYLTEPLGGDILEIGSWCGRSTAVLGEAARHTKDTRICCIDLFPGKHDWWQNADGSYSFSVTVDGKVYGGYQDQTVWKEPFERDIAPLYEKHDSVFDFFRETIARRQLVDLVEAYRADSTVLASMPQRQFRLAFVDGDHSYNAVCTDIRNIEKHLLEGGWICFDDAFTFYDGVDRAITDLIINSGAYDLCQQMTRKFFIARKRPSKHA